MFPTAVEAIGGDLGLGTSTEAVWHPSYPFKSSLTGESGRQLPMPMSPPQVNNGPHLWGDYMGVMRL